MTSLTNEQAHVAFREAMERYHAYQGMPLMASATQTEWSALYLNAAHMAAQFHNSTACGVCQDGLRTLFEAIRLEAEYQTWKREFGQRNAIYSRLSFLRMTGARERGRS